MPAASMLLLDVAFDTMADSNEAFEAVTAFLVRSDIKRDAVHEWSPRMELLLNDLPSHLAATLTCWDITLVQER